MSVIVHLSDSHFGTERAHVVRALIELVQTLAPSLAILSGDITQRARSEEFAAARRFVLGLGALPVLAVPGNHDIPLFNPLARALFPYANYQRAFGAELEPEFESRAFLVCCVNTTRRYRHTDGEVSRAQIERVAQRLREAAPEQLRVVVTHQPVHVIRKSDLQNLLHGHAAAVQSWAAAGADLILGGHIHLPYVRPLAETFPDLPRRVWAVQAGTCVSRRVRGGTNNSINVIHHSLTERSCRVERWDFDEAETRFVMAEALELALER